MVRKSRARRIVVTGVSRGLGRALVEGFVAGGHAVAGCARSRAAIDELRARHAAPHRFDAVDVSDDEAVAAWAGALLAEGPAPDLLVNNAALMNASAPLWRVPAGELSRVVDVNIKGVANVIRHLAPAMIERRRGVIVNFSSYWGRSGAAEVAPYCATKWAIEGLTAALAEELPAPLAAVALNPGVIHTEMLRSCFGDSARSYPPPEAWAAEAVPFLLSLGRAENGQQLTVPTF
jgi:NAD(P)-dependent dehydrogenase (short-subunit alcohol dehydrogenase family)